MVIAQCDALISLVDKEYHNRAWCSVEVMMMQTLKRAYGKHLWYEQVPAPPELQLDGRDWLLREGSISLNVEMANKQVTFEEDRPKLCFLERQIELLK